MIQITTMDTGLEAEIARLIRHFAARSPRCAPLAAAGPHPALRGRLGGREIDLQVLADRRRCRFADGEVAGSPTIPVWLAPYG
ncbi:MAG: hypothetical protein HT579_15955 [Candidatus Accumulibacter similis]|nr:MAG: hypothetical protein HT579_15955 [Candidatus Accumulibacter similis]